MEGKEGNFLSPRSDEDLAVVVEVVELKLTEKPSIGGGLAAVFTAGMNDKNVAPTLRASMTIYNRDDCNQLKRSWAANCNAPVLLVPESRYFSELKEDPTKGREMFSKALTVCKMIAARAE